MFNRKDLARNSYMLDGKFASKGYDWWWHSFTAKNAITGEEVPFFAECFIINPELSPHEVVLGQSAVSKHEGKRPSYVMVKLGCWGPRPRQLHKFYPVDEVMISFDLDKGYMVKGKDFLFSEDRIYASIDIPSSVASHHPELMSDAGSISLDVSLDKQLAYNVGYGAGPLFRRLKAFQMYWHAQGMKTLFEGKITCDGDPYSVNKDSSYGYSDKNWGSGFTSPWVWLSSCDLVSNLTEKRLENSAFDIGGGKPKAFGISFDRKLLSGIYYEGKEFEFNFSKFWTGCKTAFSFKKDKEDNLYHWNVTQSNHKQKYEIEAYVDAKQTININYEDPERIKRFSSLHNGGSGYGRLKLYEKKGKEWKLLDDIRFAHAGVEYGEFDKMEEKSPKEPIEEK